MFCESSDYSVFIMDRKSDVNRELQKIYPHRFDESQVLAKKFAGQKIVAVRKSSPDEDAEEFPVMFLMDRCRGFSGAVIFSSGMSSEKCVFDKGHLVSRSIVPDGDLADVVYLPAGISSASAERFAGTGSRIKYYRPDRRLGGGRKTAVEVCVLLILLVAAAVIMAETVKKRNEIARYDRIQVNEKMMAQKQRQEKLLRENCERLRKEYLAITADRRISPYRILQSISSCAGRGGIASVSMDGRSFTLDAAGDNVADIYSRFEKSDSFYGIKLVRSSPEKNRWVFTVTGNFSLAEESKNFSGIEEEIAFYESQIAFHEKVRSERKSVGETLGDILDDSGFRGCSFLFIQTSAGEGKVFIDFSFSGKEGNVLAFVRDISEKYSVHYH